MSRFGAADEAHASRRPTPDVTFADWLSLGAASRFLGVAPGTLRRWSDAGRVNVFVTPGGHRRFQRPALERLLPNDRPRRPALARGAVTPARLAHAYRREAALARRGLDWLPRLTDAQREAFRQSGRLIARTLLAHLDADGDEAERHQLAEASAEAAAHGRMTAALGLSLSEAVEAFLQFRRPFLLELAAAARRRNLDATETADVLQKAERALDHLLVATMTGHTVALVPEPAGASAPSASASSMSAASTSDPGMSAPGSPDPRLSAAPASAAAWSAPGSSSADVSAYDSAPDAARAGRKRGRP